MDGFGSGGGSLALAELIDEHGPALLADFQSEYGLDLAEVVFDRPARAVLALVEGLPDTARFVAHIQGGDDGWRDFIGWGRDRHMLADLWDLSAAVATTQGRPPTYPRSGAKTQKQGTPFTAMIPKTTRG